MKISYTYHMKYFLRLSVLLCAVTLFFQISCTKNNRDMAVQIDSGKKSRLLILAGEDFGPQGGATGLISRVYGLAEEKGRIRILYWPETFDHNNSSLRLFSSTADEEKPEIVVNLGGPEGTLRELRRIKEMFPETKIISIFPLDEAIPVEAVSDLMVDVYVPSLESDTAAPQDEKETSVEISGEETSLILLGAVLATETDGSDSVKSDSLAAGIKKAAEMADIGKDMTDGWEYLQAVDADTGIRSKKHVLIKVN